MSAIRRPGSGFPCRAAAIWLFKMFSYSAAFTFSWCATFSPTVWPPPLKMFGWSR
jgi:hypothetical protein